MIKALANGYSSESTQQELSNEYQHDRVQTIFILFLCFFASNDSNLSIKSQILVSSEKKKIEVTNI